MIDAPSLVDVAPACSLCGSPGRTVQRYPGHVLAWCAACDFAFVHPPMPRQDHRDWHDQDFFVRYYGEGIDAFYERQGPLYHREVAKKRWMVDLLRRHVPSGRILDVGTGQGLFSYLAQESGYEVWATEVCPADLAYHRRRGLRIFDGYLEDAGYEDGCFDAVTMWHTLEHVFDPLTTLGEVRRILKPGGCLVGALPNWRGLGTQLRVLLRHPLFDPATDHELHFFHYSRRALQTAFRRAGLEPVAVGRERHSPRRLRDRAVAWTGDALSVLPGIHWRETQTMVARKPR